MLTPENVRVLVIDDDEIAREFLCEVLRQSGFRVDDAQSTIGVTNMIVRGGHHVVVIDVMMPTIRGDKLAALLRKNPNLRDLAIVLVSGAPQAELAQLAAEAEIDPTAVVNKSEARAQLPAAVLRAVERRMY